ncbi:MAG: hypothetical protein ABH811_00950 [archaeon]
MKRPYLKKYGVVSKFTVWIVDGKYIRGNIEKDFTNFGQHYSFNFIPENEFWIDHENVPGEEKYFIDVMLVMDNLLSKGISHKEAVKRANIIERRERSKDKLIKEIKGKKETKEEILKKIHKKLLKKYSKKIKVWIVNGELVRDLCFMDFTEGGHDKVYHFIPKDEVWIDDDVHINELKFILLHELHERNLMSKGIDYCPAHRSSNEIEYLCRHNPKLIDKKLKEELDKIIIN